jgi:hypothetical protein
MEASQTKQKTVKRDYDKNPIVIIDYNVLFESYLVLLIALFGVPLLVIDIFQVLNNQQEMSIKLILTFCVWVYLLYIIFVDYPKKFNKNKSTFFFFNNAIQYHHKYIQLKKEDKVLTQNINKITQVSYCIICELPDSYGRLHYLSSWQLYRKSSIGVHIGKTVLYLRYLITYLFFVLPYKLYRLKKSQEPYVLLRKNLFIQFDNRNYFLVNIYSQKELEELLEYFQLHNISVKDKTYFIPHLQNQGWFVDKNEIWTEEFKNREGEIQ